MNFTWHNISTKHTQAKSMRAQAVCLRSSAYVLGTVSPVTIEIQKDFLDHGRGGSDG